MTDAPELERWNGRFAAQEYVFGTRPNAFLAAQAPRLQRGMRALCVADGEGRNSVWLAVQGLAVTAFDFSPAGLAKARALAERSAVAVDYRLSDVDDWDWSATQYDVVAAIFVQLASPPGGPKRRENLYTEELLRESFAGLEILHLAAHEAIVDEGPGHSGMSALIDLLARRPA